MSLIEIQGPQSLLGEPLHQTKVVTAERRANAVLRYLKSSEGLAALQQPVLPNITVSSNLQAYAALQFRPWHLCLTSDSHCTLVCSLQPAQSEQARVANMSQLTDSTLLPSYEVSVLVPCYQ